MEIDICPSTQFALGTNHSQGAQGRGMGDDLLGWHLGIVSGQELGPQLCTTATSELLPIPQ
jgi:hypothetical protein